jgi:biotin transport system substrate-specific component
VNAVQVNIVQVNAVQVSKLKDRWMTNFPKRARGLRLRGLDATDLARVAVFAAVVAVLGLPGGFTVLGSVPITAQTLGVMLAGAILGPWLGALSMTVLLALTALGLPLLAGGRGGVGVFVGPSAGFALGWIVGALVVGLIVHARSRRPVPWRTFLGAVAGGIFAIYALGIPVQSAVTHLPLAETALSSLVFVPGDLVKAVLATGIVMTLVRGYPRAFRRVWVAKSGAVLEPERAVVP